MRIAVINITEKITATVFYVPTVRYLMGNKPKRLRIYNNGKFYLCGVGAGGNVEWCNVSPSPTDVSLTENSRMLHPLDKVSLV
jgi:hypothetical protein